MYTIFKMDVERYFNKDINDLVNSVKNVSILCKCSEYCRALDRLNERIQFSYPSFNEDYGFTVLAYEAYNIVDDNGCFMFTEWRTNLYPFLEGVMNRYAHDLAETGEPQPIINYFPMEGI